ncbi:MAG: hypothetical protein OMM_06373 [Candidatus Magnetoglobus multicellularis str. Araruama]|uniref:Uncharacterized protein n=1 Tax=Candidatus Magnetoglobus multicellularis str. Araruama TaxID=890399 RepID=A0A1V1PHY2_9BACT|nr:MAG: hypothetical protein OMM_06373 [Candidatus Magnetoglobus multicellularis str. Araruama]
MIENLSSFEETRVYKELFSSAEKNGEKRGEKLGERASMLRQLRRYKAMNKKGDIDDLVFQKICEPIRKDLKKITKEINEMAKKFNKSH